MERLSQDEVRERFVQYVQDNGKKYYHVSHEVNVPFYVISKWKNKKTELWQKSLVCIDEFLKQHGY